MSASAVEMVRLVRSLRIRALIVEIFLEEAKEADCWLDLALAREFVIPCNIAFLDLPNRIFGCYIAVYLHSIL
eukprot:gene24932-10583_t